MRFSLRALLVVILGISILCALLFAVPDRVALLLLLVISCYVTIAAVLGIVYFDGNIRAFCIGMAAGAVNMMFLDMLYSFSMVLEEVAALLQGLNSADEVEGYSFGKLIFAYVLVSCLSGGFLGVLARQLSVRRKQRASNEKPIPDADECEV